jgi:hypothetical protein
VKPALKINIEGATLNWRKIIMQNDILEKINNYIEQRIKDTKAVLEHYNNKNQNTFNILMRNELCGSLDELEKIKLFIEWQNNDEAQR